MGAGVVKKSGGGGGRRGRRRGSSAAMADINITPFVDVMLVLLIIFIITALQFYMNRRSSYKLD